MTLSSRRPPLRSMMRAGGDGEPAFLFDDADGFARGAAGGPDIFDDQNAFAGLQFEAAAQSHLAGAIAFDEERADAESAGDFVADNQAAERGRDDARDGVIFESVRRGRGQVVRRAAGAAGRARTGCRWRCGVRWIARSVPCGWRLLVQAASGFRRVASHSVRRVRVRGHRQPVR